MNNDPVPSILKTILTDLNCFNKFNIFGFCTVPLVVYCSVTFLWWPFAINNSKKSDLVTADGGFDYSTDYNKQELSSYKLIYSEIYIALNIQKDNGSFVLKVFDIFYHKTIQLIYLLYLFIIPSFNFLKIYSIISQLRIFHFHGV